MPKSKNRKNHKKKSKARYDKKINERNAMLNSFKKDQLAKIKEQDNNEDTL